MAAARTWIPVAEARQSLYVHLKAPLKKHPHFHKHFWLHTQTHSAHTQPGKIMTAILECILLKPLNTLWSLYKQRQLLSYSLTSSLAHTHTHRHTHRTVTWANGRCCFMAVGKRKQSMKYSAKVLHPHLTQSSNSPSQQHSIQTPQPGS